MSSCVSIPRLHDQPSKSPCFMGAVAGPSLPLSAVHVVRFIQRFLERLFVSRVRTYRGCEDLSFRLSFSRTSPSRMSRCVETLSKRNACVRVCALAVGCRSTKVARVGVSDDLTDCPCRAVLVGSSGGLFVQPFPSPLLGFRSAWPFRVFTVPLPPWRFRPFQLGVASGSLPGASISLAPVSRRTLASLSPCMS